MSYDRERQLWRARVRLGFKHPRTVLHIGRFDSALEAAVAYDLAALNFCDPASVRTNGAAAEHLDVTARVLPLVIDRIIALEAPVLAAGVTPVPRPDGGACAPDTPDLIVENHGSVFILRGETDAGRAWIEEHVSSEGYQPFGLGARLVEPRYAPDIINAASADSGLVVRGA